MVKARANSTSLTEPVSNLPVSQPIEREILGIILSASELLPDLLAAGLAVTDFFYEDFRRIFNAILDLHSAGEPIDILIVHDRLGGQDSDLPLLADVITGAVIVKSHALHLVNILRRKARLRALLNLSQWMQESVQQQNANPEVLIREIRIRLDRPAPEPFEVRA